MSQSQLRFIFDSIQFHQNQMGKIDLPDTSVAFKEFKWHFYVFVRTKVTKSNAFQSEILFPISNRKWLSRCIVNTILLNSQQARFSCVTTSLNHRFLQSDLRIVFICLSLKPQTFIIMHWILKNSIKIRVIRLKFIIIKAPTAFPVY